MNREDPYRDQAERLRKKIDGGTEKKDRKKEALPPRSSLHHHKKKKTKWKLKYPVMSLLAIFFILLPIAIFSIYTSMGNEPGGEAAEASKTSYETVDFGETADEPAVAGEQTAEEGKKASAGEEQAKDSNKDTTQEEKQDTNASEPEKSSDAAAVETGAEEPEKTADKEKAAGEAQDKPAPEQKETSGGFVTHTVQPGETMFRISMKYFNSQDGIEIIRQANGLSGNEIHVGQVLKIPQNQ
jgi:LysM repeat protein